MQDFNTNNKKNKTKGTSIQNWYQKNRPKWWFKLIGLLVVIVLTAISTNIIFSPEFPHPDIKITYSYLTTIPFRSDFPGDLRLDYKAEENIFVLLILIHNQGKKEDKYFEFKIFTVDENIKLKPAQIILIPSLLNVIDKANYNDGKNGLYRKIETFPIDSKIYIQITPEAAIKKGDINFEFLSEYSSWIAIEGKIELEDEVESKSWFWLFGGIEIINKAFAEQEQNETNQKKSSSGVFIGGYDPLIMTNNVFKILQEEKLITTEQAHEIKTIVEVEKKGILFSVVNVLKFNEVILNSLIRNKIFSKDEALDILQKSKEAGGVLISGYNIVVLEVEILNLLIKKGELDKDRGQWAVDKAKRMKSPIEENSFK